MEGSEDTLSAPASDEDQRSSLTCGVWTVFIRGVQRRTVPLRKFAPPLGLWRLLYLCSDTSDQPCHASDVSPHDTVSHILQCLRKRRLIADLQRVRQYVIFPTHSLSPLDGELSLQHIGATHGSTLEVRMSILGGARSSGELKRDLCRT